MSSIAFNNNPEDNPFADPFSRPRSPDPWSSYIQQQQTEPDVDAVPQTQSDSSTPTGRLDAQYPAIKEAPLSAQNQPPADPLEFSVSEDVLHPASIPITPQLSTVSATIVRERDMDKEEVKSKSIAPQATNQSPYEISTTSPSTNVVQSSQKIDSAPSLPAERAVKQLTPKKEPVSSKPQLSVPAPSQRIRTPLDLPSPSPSGQNAGWTEYNQTQHFEGLSIGGETRGVGWKFADIDVSESTFVNGEQANETEPEDANTEYGNTGPNTSSNEQDAFPATSRPLIQPTFVITVEDPQKVGDPIRPYTMYTVHTKTTSPLFSQSSFSVLRRYSDFLWLYETLAFNNPGVVVPPVPEKSPFGRFQDTFVEQRRLGLQHCIQKIASHNTLSQDPDFVFFLESDNFALDVKHRKAEAANGNERATGGLIASIGSTIAGIKFYEVDEWFEQKKIYLDGLEGQLRGLGKAIDAIAKNRQEMSVSLSELSETLAELSSADLSKRMVVSLATLAEVERRSKELHDEQARDDTITIMNTVDEYIRIIASVRSAFASRIRLHAIWQATDSDVRRIKANQEKARRQGRLPSDRLAHSLAEVQESERRAADAKREYDKASRLIKSEVARFEKERIEDFKNSLEHLLNGMIDRQKEVIRSWETYQEQLLRKANPISAVTRSPEVSEQGVESDINPFAASYSS